MVGWGLVKHRYSAHLTRGRAVAQLVSSADTVHPIMLTLANFSLRERKRRCTKICVGFLPVPKMRRRHGGPAERRTRWMKAADLQLYHDALALNLSQLNAFAENGIELRQRDGSSHRFAVRLCACN